MPQLVIGSRRFIFFLLACMAFTMFADIGRAYADSSPVVHAEWIDDDGQVSQTSWRSSSNWIWSQTHLLLQTAIEIPAHIASTFPEPLKSHLRGNGFRTSFTLQDDHLFLLLELKNPVTLFKLDSSGHHSLRITVTYDHTNWMRNGNCRMSNPSMNEISDLDIDSTNENPDAFFISLYCRPQAKGTWVDVANSGDVTLDFEPLEGTRFRRTENGTTFWIPSSERLLARHLAKIKVIAANGEATSEYELLASPMPQVNVSLEQLDQSSLLPSAETRERFVPIKSDAPAIGLEAQFMSASGTHQARRTGVTGAELAISGRAEVELDHANHFADFDLELPVRRLGAGLDAKGASSHLTWLNAGYEFKDSQVSWTVGAQTSLLDVRSPNRTSIWSLSPSVQAHFGKLYSATLAPFDLSSNLSVLRGRADIPLFGGTKNRLTLEALLGRTLIQPQKNSWDVDGLTLGFVGEF